MKDIIHLKEDYISLLREVKRDGVEDLIKFIEGTDFFKAPASTIFHSNFEGGLCLHSLNVYKNLKSLVETFNLNYSNDSIILVSLLHDLSKSNFYEIEIRNEKKYSEEGRLSDSFGRFDWKQVPHYKVKSSENRFISGSHGFNSFMLASRYVPLSEEEISAIVNHHAGLDDNAANKDLPSVFHKWPLVLMLHQADMIATYLDE